MAKKDDEKIIRKSLRINKAYHDAYYAKIYAKYNTENQAINETVKIAVEYVPVLEKKVESLQYKIEEVEEQNKHLEYLLHNFIDLDEKRRKHVTDVTKFFKKQDIPTIPA